MTHKPTIDGVPLELLANIEMTWRQASGFSNKANNVIAQGLGELRDLLAKQPTCAKSQVDPSAIVSAAGDPCNWTDTQVLEFLGVALRNVDLVGTVRIGEIRQGFEYMRDRLPPAPAPTPPLPAAGPWIDGSPPSPWGSETFLAHTVHGDKVVLSPLPEEYSYDFQTADGTYMMRVSIKRWAQLSTSQFIDYDAKAEAEQAQLASEPVALSAAAVVRDGDDGQYLDWLLEGGIAELVPGQVLIVADQDVTDDEGHGELYRLPPGAES